jgi:hypothetical protein
MTKNRKKILFSKLKEEILLKKKLNIGNKKDLPFVCRSCRKLVVLNNPYFLYRAHNDIEIDCNECQIEYLRHDRPREAFTHALNETAGDDFEKKTFLMNHIRHWDS